MRHIKSKNNSRILYLDILRVLAIFAVIILHISAPFVGDLYFNNPKSWWTGNITNSMTRWSVPILIMISGNLMLSNKKEERINIFFKKRLSKILIPLAFWSTFYMVINPMSELKLGLSFLLSLGKRLYTGEVYIHLWYLYMIVGLYLITPIIKVYVNNTNGSNLIYFISIWFISNGLFNFFQKFTGYGIGFYLHFFHWSIGYYILGFILGNFKFSMIYKNIIHALGIIGLIITALGTYIFTIKNNGIYIEHFHSYYAPNVIFTSISLFLLFKDTNWKSLVSEDSPTYKMLLNFSNTSYGIYLVHIFVLRLISSKYIGINILESSLPLLISIVLVGIITFLLSHIITKTIQKIPFINMIV